MGTIDVVRGRKIERTEGGWLRDRARAAERVVVDVGTGDGRGAYRLARANPGWLVVGVDASADRLREVSFRAGRKPARGGSPNAVFVRASLERLPEAFERVADEVSVDYPWGTLLRAALGADLDGLRALARIGKPGARLAVRVNLSALDGSAPEEARVRAAYAAAGIRVGRARADDGAEATTWGRRLGARAVLAIEGTVADWPRERGA